MENKIAAIISKILHPLFIPTYLLLIFLNVDFSFSMMITLKGKFLMLALVFLTTAVIPAFLILIYYRMGWVKSLYLEERKERMLPLFTAGVMFLIAAIMLKNLQMTNPYFYLLLGAAVMTVVVMLITNFWKISVHTTSMGGMLGASIALAIHFGIDIPLFIYVIAILSGIVGYARLKLKAHNESQVYGGYIAGFLSMFLLFSYF